MNDPYMKLSEDISNALIKLSNMICWLAMRTLPVKDYNDFISEFKEKQDTKKDALNTMQRVIGMNDTET